MLVELMTQITQRHVTHAADGALLYGAVLVLFDHHQRLSAMFGSDGNNHGTVWSELIEQRLRDFRRSGSDVNSSERGLFFDTQRSTLVRRW